MRVTGAQSPQEAKRFPVSHTPNSIVEKTIHMPRWAVVGASDNPERYSYRIIRLLKERGYTVYPVSPKLKELMGLKVYPSIREIPKPVDVVDMVVNPRIGINVMQEVADQGIRYVWLQPGAESDEIHAFAGEKGIAAIDACILAVLSIKRDHRIGTLP